MTKPSWKKAVHGLLHRSDADEYTKTYARLVDTYQNIRDELYRLLI